jgi:GUN4-like/ARM-like repeat domain, GUN4-N terminal
MSPVRPNSAVSPESIVSDPMDELLSRLLSESEKNQLQLVQDLATKGETGVSVLIRFLSDRQSQPVGLAEGKAYQVLVASDSPTAHDFVQTTAPTGILPTPSAQGIDYEPLQMLLAKQEYQTADRVTLEKMCELAGDAAIQRNWIYFTDVEQFPGLDLQTINKLWLIYSEGKFGFSVQRELWLGTGRNWDKLWPLIGWKNGNIWTRYPNEFTWSLNAPRGHLPLSNQLRGVRTMAALLDHPVWTQSPSS